MEYRKEIDGLRAFAILPVVLFHSGLPLFSGGYIGVDIFFVISGYLITSIIFPRIINNNFSFLWFYESRIRRLFPALFLMILISSLFAFFLLDPIKLTEFAYSIFSSIFFYSNFFFWHEIDYFETESELMPLLHTWSLSIEEQFYIFFPVFLIVLVKTLKKYTLVAVTVFCFISFLIWIYGNIYYPTATFYLPITRAWELLAGASLAIYVFHHGYFKSKWASSIGLVILFLSFYFFSSNLASKNLLMFMPVLGTLLILGLNKHSRFVDSFLKNKVAIFFGLISYSLYLFHQPIFAYAKIFFIDLGVYQILALCCLAIFVSFLSWNFVEKFFRKRFNSKFNFPQSLLIISVPLLLSIFLASYSIITDGNKTAYFSKLSPEQLQTHKLIEKVKNENEKDEFINTTECVISSNSFTEEIKLKILKCNEKFGAGTLFFGDSHAKDIFNSYQYLNKSKFIVGLSANFCQGHNTFNHCYYRELSDFLKLNSEVFNKIYFHQAGYFFLSQNNQKLNDKHSLETLSMTDETTSFKIIRNRIEQLKLNLQVFPDSLIVIGPRIEPHIQTKYLKKYSCDHQFKMRDNLSSAFISLDSHFEKLFSNNNYVSLQKIINFSMSKDFVNCKKIYWSDGDHWSRDGEQLFSGRLINL